MLLSFFMYTLDGAFAMVVSERWVLCHVGYLNFFMLTIRNDCRILSTVDVFVYIVYSDNQSEIT